MIKMIKVQKNQVGVWYQNQEIKKVFLKGNHYIFSLSKGNSFELYDTKDFYFSHSDLRDIYKSERLAEHLSFIDLKDDQRALLWLDNRFEKILSKGLHAVWKDSYNVDIEIFDIRTPRFEHKYLNAIIGMEESALHLNSQTIEEGHEGLFFHNGTFQEKLAPGNYAFWKNNGQVKLYKKDIRDKILEIAGQDIMTADNVTLRLSSIITYRISDTLKSVMALDDIDNVIYREGQLALRSVIGTRELDAILKEKNSVSNELISIVKEILLPYGITVVRLGIRDIILPGDMKDILNGVMEAKKKAEATLICKREETASTRSQANTAKMLENNPTLLRMRELEIIEQAVQNGKFNFILGDQSISKGVMNLI